MNGTCPECGCLFKIGRGVKENGIVSCPECGSNLEVLSLDPVHLAPPKKKKRKK